MDNKEKRAFTAVKAFVEDLVSVFGDSKKPSPLTLYNRLLGHIKPEETDSVTRILDGFKEFLGTYENYLVEGGELPRGTKIRFSDRVFIDIQKFLYKSDESTKDAIKSHLLTISAILEPNKDKKKNLEKQLERMSQSDSSNTNIFRADDDGSAESEFINNIMDKMPTIAENMGGNIDINNPAGAAPAIMNMMQSGVLQDLFSAMNPESGKNLNGKKLLKGISKMLSKLEEGMPEQGSDSEPELLSLEPNSEVTNSEVTNSEITNSEVTNSEVTNLEPNSEVTNSEVTNLECDQDSCVILTEDID